MTIESFNPSSWQYLFFYQGIFSILIFSASLFLYRKVFSSKREIALAAVLFFLACFFCVSYIFSIYLSRGESATYIYDAVIGYYYVSSLLLNTVEINLGKLIAILAIISITSLGAAFWVYAKKPKKESVTQKAWAVGLFMLALFFHPGIPLKFAFIFASLTIFAISIYAYRKVSSSTCEKIVFSIFVLLFYLLNLVYTLADYLTSEGINNAVIYHIKIGLAGAGLADFKNIIAVSSVGLIFSFIFAFWVFTKKSAEKNVRQTAYAYVLILVALLLHPGAQNLADLYLPTLSMARAEHSDFNYFYKPPHSDSSGNGKKLVVIYAESFEKTYFDESLFPGLVTELRSLSQDGTDFSDISAVDGASWTMGGIVTSQCGLPLYTLTEPEDSPEAGKFMAGAFCIGDFLHEKGYRLAYLGGADLNYGGKGDFFKAHSFDEVNGRAELSAKVEDKKYRNTWGLYDDTLFDLAYDKFLDMSSKDDKSALFLLTLATHEPKGYLPENCSDVKYRDGSNAILNSVKCSDLLIAEFVRKIMDSPYGKDTVVAVLSDHLANRNSATYLLTRKERKNMFFIIDPKNPKGKTIDLAGSQLDSGATILSHLGFDTPLGLGRNLEDSSMKEDVLKMIRENLRLWELDMEFLWDPIKNKKTLNL